jgi:hypothetical protein
MTESKRTKGQEEFEDSKGLIRRFQNIRTKAYPVRPFQLHDLFVVSLI